MMSYNKKNIDNQIEDNAEIELIDIDLSGIIPVEAGEPKYDYRKMLKYCEKNNKKTEDLTDKELKQFITGYFV